ncbi:MAG: cell division protein ZapA [Cocleimonas sp.]|nr:cell division protein ZapA [Cocleimonas sp.]
MSDEQSNAPVPVSIRILGKDYMVACPAGEQASLISSAKEVDGKMREIRRSGKIIGSERIAVITALNLSNELNEANSRVAVIDDDIIKRVSNLKLKAALTLEHINVELYKEET